MTTRGCGSRVAGGIYLTVATGTGGKPLEHFTVCQPVHEAKYEGVMMAIDRALGLSPKGVKLITRGDVTHVYDWIGEKYYPNVLDFWHEARQFGVSRRLELGSAAEYARLTPDSRLLLLHRRAYISNSVELTRSMSAEAANTFLCPRHDFDENLGFAAVSVPSKTVCPFYPRHSSSGLWWHDIEGGEPDETSAKAGVVTRELPCGVTYKGMERPEGFVPRYQVAIFASLPIDRFEFVDPENRYGKRKTRLEGAQVPVETVPF